MTLSTRAITRPIPETINLKAAKWDKFRETISNVENITIHENMSTADIDNKLEIWYSIIKDSI